MNPTGIIFILVGLFALCGGIFNWEWFMNHRKARFIIKMLGRAGARILYVVLGIAFVILGILCMVGIIELS